MVRVAKTDPAQATTQAWQDEKTKQTQIVITKLRHKSEEEEASVFAAKLGLPYVDTNLIPVSNESIRTILEEDSKNFDVVAIQKDGKHVALASTDPTKKETADFIESLQKENHWDLKIFVISHYNLKKIQEKYKTISFADILSELSVNLSDEELEKSGQYLKDLVSLKDKIFTLSTTEILNIIMGGSYKLDASDIHLEPQEQDLRLRYRIDGVLHDVMNLPLEFHRSVISRIKMMSGMKLNLRDIAQDGTFEIRMKDKRVAIRVSIIPEILARAWLCVFWIHLPFK